MKWSKSGGDLPAGRAQTLANGTLELKNLQVEDAGEYVCTASIGKFEFTVGKILLIWPGKPMTVSQRRRCSLTHLREDSVPYLYRMKHQDLTANKVFFNRQSCFQHRPGEKLYTMQCRGHRRFSGAKIQTSIKTKTIKDRKGNNQTKKDVRVILDCGIGCSCDNHIVVIHDRQAEGE